MKMSLFLKSISIVFFSFPLFGCFLGEESKGLESTQIAAKVNGVEITFSEFNEYLKRIPANTKDETEIAKIKARVLDSLIDQKLIIEAAKSAEIHKSSDVINAIDIAKNKIIVDAYLNKVFSGSSEPNDSEIDSFYNENSLVFNERKQFVYDQYVLPANSDEVTALTNKIKLLDKSGQLKDFFSNLGRKYSHSREVRTSEQLPKQLVKAMNVLKEKDIGFFKVTDGLVVIGLHDVVSIPISSENAKKIVKNELRKNKKLDSQKRLVESLKADAKIEFNPNLDFDPNEAEISK